MKIIPTTKLALVLCTAVLAALLTFTPSARALTIGANYGNPSGVSDRVTYVNHLVGMARITKAELIHPRPQAVPANHINSGYAREIAQAPRPGMVPRLNAVPPGGTGGKGVPDGGVTAMLLGTALGALGIARRYLMG